MTILIIGSGSYVIGDPFGPGVVLRSVIQWLQDKAGDVPHKIVMTVNTPSLLPSKQKDVAAILNELDAEPHVSIEFVTASEATDKLSAGLFDSCFISVPDKYHAEYIRACMSANVPVWVVKPLTGDAVSADSLLSEQRAHNARVWVDYHKRFDVSNRLLKKQIVDGAYGKLLSYSVDYHQPRSLPIDIFDWTEDVDVFTYIGCHYVDQIHYLFPEAELTSVVADPLKGEVFAKTGQHDGVLAMLRFTTSQGTVTCPMNVGWFNPAGAPTKSLQTLKVQFERGLVELDQTRRGVSVWDDKGVAEINPYFFCAAPDALGRTRYSGYGYDSVSQFLDLASSNAPWPNNPNLPTLEEAAKTDRVVSAVQRAFKTGEKIVFEK